MVRLLAMIKPWGINYLDDILERLDKHGRLVKLAKVDQISLEDISAHYAILRSRENFNHMIMDFVGLPAVLAIYVGDQELFDTLKDRIREEYDAKVPVNPNHKRNVLHISNSEEEYLREMQIWSKF